MSAEQSRAIGARLRQLRLEAGLSQADVEVRTGLRRQNLGRLENGRSRTSAGVATLPRLDTLLTIARALGVPVTRVVSVLDEGGE